MTKKKEAGNRRLQLEFTSDTYARIEDLREKSNCTTKAELIRQAIAVFSFFIKESLKGNRIQSVSPKGEVTRIVMPTFMNDEDDVPKSS